MKVSEKKIRNSLKPLVRNRRGALAVKDYYRYHVFDNKYIYYLDGVEDAGYDMKKVNKTLAEINNELDVEENEEKLKREKFADEMKKSREKYGLIDQKINR